MSDKELTERYNLVKSMDTIVKSLNDEGAYYNHWIYIVPDEADDDDFLDIAEDEETFVEAVRCFKGIVREYMKSGFYVAGELY